MSAEGGTEVLLTVRAAEKRDAGRGVARVPESARRDLGVLSGDTVLVEGSRRTVLKVWPADADVPDGVIQIDADARANAGANVGDQVQVYAEEVADATTIRLSPPESLRDVPDGIVERAITRDLEGHPVSVGERIRLERIAAEPFRIAETTPESPVRITAGTRIVVEGAGSPTTPKTETSGQSNASGGGATAERGSGGSSAAQPSEPTSGVTYEDIGGLDDELELVREMVELPLSEPDLFRKLGIDPPRGVLLYGPPGTGKTLIAKAVANEVNASFHHVSGPEVMSKYKGDSEKKIRETFQAAREDSPAIVFFDEIDSIAGKRDDESDVENRVVAQLLSLMDGLESRGDVVVIGATNRVDSIDPALRRGGRFDREIEIGVPDENGRREILDVHTRGMPLGDDVDLDRIARRTHGFVGADLDSVASEAAMVAIRNRPTEEEARSEWNHNPTVGRSDFESALASVEPSAMREYIAEKPNVNFADVGGLDDAKETLREAVEWPLAYGPLFEAANTTPPSGVLLHGPPGTGKTLLARALAGESGVNFIRVDGPELLDRYVGESEKAVRKVFERARQSAPSIVFLDEIDAVAGQRGSDTNEVTERVVSQLLTELDGLAENPNLVVLAATNRKHHVDDALLRPGRLDTHILVPEPDEAGRRKIFEVTVEGRPLGDDVDLDDLAARTEGMTGADIDGLVRTASMRAIREIAEGIPPEEANERTADLVIGMDDFEAALERLRGQ
ncbi:AAA family ATPase [Haloarchaeobius iranensis]|uniref:Transitional endoplasmic reticulum ATPase n=1 Tax=Haloarchaeobius iranensis TaxID=996166 RepID=A0A1G9UJQ6_9EURY|nr:AAA family ATPase [Haloarchaeobius iranensis]SDM60151.1 transitional endoplasmic reticulum ATPase [Haloarchaeobius iranensis]